MSTICGRLGEEPVTDAVFWRSRFSYHAPEPPFLRAKNELFVCGFKVWKDWQHEIEPMLNPDGRLADAALKFWGGKLAGNTARMAALLHIACTAPANCPDEVEISEATAQRAVDAARVMIDHSIAVHDLAATDQDKFRAIQILERIKRTGSERVTVRDLHQSLRRRESFQNASDVRTGCSILVDHGWLYLEPQ